ncbi:MULTISPECIES: DUF3618 domain-containing protein [Dermacoccus]|jgi:hypothetical protein|uniref:DUF3618 domain-containing protein n=3 Tax=Dermacoccus TaxID=57495 RepID=A0A417Z2E4_9MICO|nr:MULTISPECIES: DUF3618 domain-containing protein [Dermacoccus]KLO62933.1 hypothetical protein AA983_05805 [Dermacoccus sp. PE3]MBZ4496959.1 DUF3618 domain-containing protein [Dermacoccus sp. Tok2021]MCT1987525.1 DUF3618 domain-containing protein [Dermacoccus abyssi]QEH92881.1 DUF3618 domain-containing protein [Dermacoccus abyssi]QNK52496.1 DUF3618 domain-containing protein [Dermacoccus sp. PAMC28757]
MAPKTAKQIEAELAASRSRLAGTIDELAFRAQPKEIAKRQTESARLALTDATRTADGDLRQDRVAMGLGGVGAFMLLVGLAKRLRS